MGIWESTQRNMWKKRNLGKLKHTYDRRKSEKKWVVVVLQLLLVLVLLLRKKRKSEKKSPLLQPSVIVYLNFLGLYSFYSSSLLLILFLNYHGAWFLAPSALTTFCSYCAGMGIIFLPCEQGTEDWWPLSQTHQSGISKFLPFKNINK